MPPTTKNPPGDLLTPAPDEAPPQDAATTEAPPEATVEPAASAAPPPPPKTVVFNPFGKFQARPVDYLRALIAGPTASGKTRLILSMPRPIAVLYAERSSGDVDLRNREHEGIYLIYIDRQKPLDSVNEVLNNILTGPAKDVGFQSIAGDSVSHLADWTHASRNRATGSPGQR
jgi:hypothetical protein